MYAASLRPSGTLRNAPSCAGQTATARVRGRGVQPTWGGSLGARLARPRDVQVWTGRAGFGELSSLWAQFGLSVLCALSVGLSLPTPFCFQPGPTLSLGPLLCPASRFQFSLALGEVQPLFCPRRVRLCEVLLPRRGTSRHQRSAWQPDHASECGPWGGSWAAGNLDLCPAGPYQRAGAHSL